MSIKARRNAVLKSSIGLKSIQMSQTTMTGNSYIEPLRQIIVENNIENSENIKKIGQNARLELETIFEKKIHIMVM